MIKLATIALALLLPTLANAGDILINSHSHKLTYTDDEGTHVYPVGVGKQGAGVHGVFRVVSKEVNPSWTPTPNMIKHGADPHTVPPGPKNPLGVRHFTLSGPVQYIGIHGTNNERSVGHDVSHGCFRLHKKDILDLYDRVPVGTTVIVR